MKKNIDIDNLIEEYKQRLPVCVICDKYNVSKQTIYNILKNRGIDLNRQKVHENCGCPLFKKDLYNNIYCEDFEEWEFLTLSFANRALKNEHKQKYCYGNYTQCAVFGIISE